MNMVWTLAFIAVTLVPQIAHRGAAAPLVISKDVKLQDLLPGNEYCFTTIFIDRRYSSYKGVVLEMNDEIVTVLAHETQVTNNRYNLYPFVNVGMDVSSGWQPASEQVNLRKAEIASVRALRSNRPRAKEPGWSFMIWFSRRMPRGLH